MIEKDRGFILKRFNFRETSVIAVIYSRRFGKIKGIFKGFYSNKKEFMTTLDIFSLNEIIFYPKSSEIWLVSEAELISDFPYLRKNIEKAKVAAFFFNLLDKAMPLWDQNEAIFNLTNGCIKLIESSESKAFFIFLIKFLTLAGIKPEFNHCIVCQGLVGKQLFFSAGRGGLVCQRCSFRAKDCRAVSRELSKAFSYLQNSSLEAGFRLNLSLNCQKEIIDITKTFLAYHFDFNFQWNKEAVLI